MNNVSQQPSFVPVEIDPEDIELRNYLASITPQFVHERVPVESRLELIDMIRRAVPGYGPH
jgi:hypothetical protein